MSIRYRLYESIDQSYQTLKVDKEKIPCLELKKRFEEELLKDKTMEISISFDDHENPSLFTPCADEEIIPRNATVVIKSVPKQDQAPTEVSEDGPSGLDMYQPKGSGHGVYKQFAK